jgi:hypothetical protein
MTASKRRTLVVALTIAVLGLLAIAGVSQGAAVTGTFEFSDTFSAPVDFTGTCLGPGASGTLTHIETTVGHFTGNGPPAFGFHDHATSTDDVRAEFVDGRSVVGTIVAHFNDNATHLDQLTSTAGAHGTGTLYGSDGQPLGPVSTHQVFHISYRDANGNHQPDAGEVTTTVDRFSLTC